MSVIDAMERFPQCRVMLTHDEILAELRRAVDEKRVKQNAIAAHLGIAAPRVKEMLNGDRRIQSQEMAPLADYLGMTKRMQPTMLRMNVALPSEASLTAMFEGLLETAGQEHLAAELAPRLAQLLPSGLAEAQAREPDPVSDEAQPRGEDARPPATTGRDKPRQLSI